MRNMMGGNSSLSCNKIDKKKKKKKREKGLFQDFGFTDLVFSWSLEDILNEDLYKNQVEKIPLSFKSIKQYFSSYIYPLLEETRADLASSMEIMHRAPFAEIISFGEAKPYGESLYAITVDTWRNKNSDRGKEPYRTLPGDVFILSDGKPKTASDLQRPDRTWAFAIVTKISDDRNTDDNTTCVNFKVKTSKVIEVQDARQKSLFVVFVANLTTNKRIWKSLHMRRNLEIVKHVLSIDSEVETISIMPSHTCDISQLSQNFNLDLFSELNDSQRDAILASLDKVQCVNKSPVELIWGPPGTGKTKTIGVLLFILLKMNCRTLICAPTNVAIMQVASRLLSLMKESFKAANDGPFCSFGDVLLFGNKERLRIESDVKEIYLEHRVQRLINCLGPLTGWRHCISSMIQFLEDCVPQYRLFVENESIKKDEGSGENEFGKLKTKSFLAYVRDRFRCIAAPLKTCIVTFCTHLPRCFLKDDNFKNMVRLHHMLGSLESMLFQRNLVSKELEALFSCDEMITDSVVLMNNSSLNSLRTESISILKTLLPSLGKLGLPSTMSARLVEKFCFQRAALVLCTASTSFKLHSVNMEPLNFLVIDEAAQLKECESSIPLQLAGIKHAIFIGDERQLPAMVNSNVSAEAHFGRSLFERLSLLGHSKHMLNVQYRMHPSLSLFPNQKFYQSQLLDAKNVTCKNYKKQYLPGRMFGQYSFINIVGGREEVDDVGHSRRNLVEVAVVAKILQCLYRAWNTSKKKFTIGVISPYAAQVVSIQDKLGKKYDNIDGFSVKVKSIDGFQGGEEDIIIISTVRSNIGGSIGFMSNPQRTNVALTRARHCLWILGNERTLARSESVWEELVTDAKNRQCFFDAGEDDCLRKTIIDATKKFDEFDDLLNGNNLLIENAKWKVHFSDSFRKSFAKLKSSRIKKSVLNLLLRLSTGRRSKKRNVDTICEHSSHIVKEFKVDGFHIVCTIDILKIHNYIQVLKVWDILPSEEIPKLTKHLDSIFTSYTDNFINCCKEKCFEGNLEVPKIWAASTEIIRFKNQTSCELSDEGSSTDNCRNSIENSKVRESLLLMKFYPLSSSVVKHLLSDHDGRELELPYEVTDEQMDIVLFGKSSFVLGLSGTGKTTILTKKLFQREERHHSISEQFFAADSSKSMDGEDKSSVLRQLFVTVSPKLCDAVKRYVSNMKSFACGGNFSIENSSIDFDEADTYSEFNDIPDSFVNIPVKKYPLVITFRKFLMMLDGTLGSSYFERFQDVRELSLDSSTSSRSLALRTFLRTKEVNYDCFCSHYWPHFNTQHTKKLEPSKVFIEIMSHIKGGNKAGESHDGKMSRKKYILLCKGQVSTLTRQMREIVYDIYQDYERMKTERGEYDLCDLVCDIHRRLGNHGYGGDKMDFVYIDEVQDLTIRQICLFKYICPNIEEGFVFAGDTAQTIARGIDFRLEDVRYLFDNEFIGDRLNGRKGKGIVSRTFHRKQNFRTHAGVLNFAQSVIQLLYHFFPHSIDILPPETSDICGEAPVLLESGNDENAIVTIFGNNGTGRDIVGFGAEQVILVRDDVARMEISKYVGKNALVLTLLECKGLEFQDVLLYNFFGSSPLEHKWRVIYGYMEEQELLDNTPSPSFSLAKHNGLCSELKQLYVAITRTRQRLWICENIRDLSDPMFDYWKRKNLVQVSKLDDSLIQTMQVPSSPEEWKKRGIKLFEEKIYEMAIMCFERAGDVIWEKLARASGLRTSAQRMRGSNPEDARNYLREAAKMFESVGKSHSAASCYYDLEDYEKAGRIYQEKCGDLEMAALCFTKGGCYEIAAGVYAKGNYFSECLSACTKGNLFELGLQYIEYWKQHKEVHKLQQTFLESCARNYYERKDSHSMMKFVRAFCSMDSKRSFLKSLDCLDELLLLEEESENFANAAEIARLRGYVLKEADILGKSARYEESSSLVLSYVFYNSLWANGSTGWPLKQFEGVDELFLRAKSMAKLVSEFFYNLVCNEINILSHQKCCLSALTSYLHSSRQCTSLRGEILAIRKILDAHFHLKSSKYEWEDELPVDIIKYSEEKISQNKVSAKTLVFFWNLWRDNIMKVFKYLDCLEMQETGENVRHGDFCLNYFGVRKQLSHTSMTYVLQCPDADWVKRVDERSFQRTGNVVSLDVQQLVSAAKYYWQSEVARVGMKVLQTLEALHKFSTRASVFRQSTCLIHMFEVSKFLLGCKYLNHKHLNKEALENFLNISTNYIQHVFPLDWRKTLTDDMISLRKTDVSNELLHEFILQTINKCRVGLSYDEIGRVLMVWLGSGMPAGLLKEIIGKFDWNFSWKSFVNNLIGECSSENHYLVEDSLQKALRDAYCANWRQPSFMTPNCFFYLVERLLILASRTQGLIFTTKSCFLEWILYQQGADISSTAFVKDEIRLSVSDGIFNFVFCIIEQFLRNFVLETTSWVKNSVMDTEYYSPLLVLKLFMIMLLLCLKSPCYLELLFHLLGMGDITCLLPKAFLSVLQRGRSPLNLSPYMVAEAFRKIGDPLVIATWGKAQNIHAPDAIFVDLSSTRSGEDVMMALFPRNTGPPQFLADQLPLNNDTDEKISVAPSCTYAGSGAKPNVNPMAVKEEQLEVNWQIFQEISDALLSNGKGDSLSSMPINASKIKRDLEKNVSILTAAIVRFSKGKPCDRENMKTIDEANCALNDMMLLSAAYSVGCRSKHGFDILRISEILRKVQCSRPRVDDFLNELTMRDQEKPMDKDALGNNKHKKGRKSRKKDAPESSKPTTKADSDKEDNRVEARGSENADLLKEGGCEEAKESQNNEEGKSSALPSFVASENQTKGKNHDAEKKKDKGNNKHKKGHKDRKKDAPESSKPTTKADSNKAYSDKEGTSSALPGFVAFQNQTTGKNHDAEKKKDEGNNKHKKGCIGRKKDAPESSNPTTKANSDKEDDRGRGRGVQTLPKTDVSGPKPNKPSQKKPNTWHMKCVWVRSGVSFNKNTQTTRDQ